MKHFFRIGFKRTWLVVLLTVVAGLCVAYFAAEDYTPTYASTMKILIANTEGDRSSSLFDEIRSAQLLASDFSEIITSHTLLNAVIEQTGLSSESVESLKERIDVKLVKDTRILEITVGYSNPVKSMEIINNLEKNFRGMLEEMHSAQSFQVIDKPSVNPDPVGMDYYYLFIVLGAFGGMVLGMTINFILEDLIKRIDNKDAVGKLLGLQVIGIIPESNMHRSEYNAK